MKDPKIYLQQLALKSLGHYTGKLDGDEGPLTRSAFTGWLATLPQDEVKTFEETVAGWGLKFFTARELLTKGSAHAQNGLNTDPPRELWENIRDAALAVDEARKRLGSRITIASAYRSPAYNQAIGGAKKSYHMQFRALDLIPLRATVEQLHAVLLQLRKEGYAGCQGIGKYKTFCHIDNGPERDF